MKKYILIFLLTTPLKLLAINPETIKKYPYQLLTNDYELQSNVVYATNSLGGNSFIH